MAKRRRLNPARPDFLSGAVTPATDAPPARPLPSAPPIAQVAGAGAATSALQEVTDALVAARAEGRLIQALPLEQIEAGYLSRDRLASEEDELQVLMASIRARGQTTPIEVTELGEGRYGLISGWRRLTALRRLHQETAEARFATVQALLRRPEDSSDAYIAMVEENEIRLGVSFYERARVAALAAQQGVFASESEALKALFGSVSRSRRSKIGSFLAIFHALDEVLSHPAKISERQGLALSKALTQDGGLAARLRDQLQEKPSRSLEEEQAILNAALSGQGAPATARPEKPVRKELRPGVFLEISGPADAPRLVLTGKGVDTGFRARLEDWLKTHG